MNKEFFGALSGIVVIVSIIPYAIRVYQRKIHPNVTSWSLWTMISLTLLLTYRSSGAEANVWPAVFGFTNPLLLTVILVWRKEKWEKLSKLELVCLLAGLASLVMWIYTRESKGLVQWALYVGLVADTCASIPTINFVWKNPSEDRPFAWVLFSVGYSIAIFAITEHTVVNYALPIYMIAGCLFIAMPLVIYRIKHHTHFMEWI